MQRVVKGAAQQLKDFCLIQLQMLVDREMRLRKELHNCKLQREFLEQFMETLKED